MITPTLLRALSLDELGAGIQHAGICEWSRLATRVAALIVTMIP
jgi:hypothetical protein